MLALYLCPAKANAWKSVHNNIVKANEFNEAACEAAVKIGEVFGTAKVGTNQYSEGSDADDPFNKHSRRRYRKIASIKEKRFERSSYGIGGPPPPPPPPPP